MYRPKHDKNYILDKLRNREIIYDHDFDGIPIKEVFELIDCMSIEQLMDIKEGKIRAYLHEYSEKSDFSEYYEINEKKGVLYDKEKEE